MPRIPSNPIHPTAQRNLNSAPNEGTPTPKHLDHPVVSQYNSPLLVNSSSSSSTTTTLPPSTSSKLREALLPSLILLHILSFRPPLDSIAKNSPLNCTTQQPSQAIPDTRIHPHTHTSRTRRATPSWSTSRINLHHHLRVVCLAQLAADYTLPIEEVRRN